MTARPLYGGFQTMLWILSCLFVEARMASQNIFKIHSFVIETHVQMLKMTISV